MKGLNKLLILFLISALILGVGAVSAADDLGAADEIISTEVSTDLNAIDDSLIIEDSNLDDVISANEENDEKLEIQSGGESATLKQDNGEILRAGKTIVVNGTKFSDISSAISSASSGDTIVLNGTYLGSESEILVSKSVTITGVGNTILNARKMSGIFKITAADVTLNNLNLYYCNRTVINWTGANGVMSNCAFMNNSQLCWYGVGGNISDCYFNSRSFWYNNTLLLDNCTFDSVNCHFSGNGTIINNCIFKNLNSIGDIYLFINYGYNCSITNSSFENMRSGFTCFNDQGSNNNITNCTFKNLTTTGSSYSLIRFNSNKIMDCSFEKCYGNYSFITVYGYSTFERSYFTNISSSPYGGLYFRSGGRVDYCNFINCSSEYYGSAIRTYNSNVLINYCIFDNNNNINNIDYNRSTIYFEGINGSVYRCFFGQNFEGDSNIYHILFRNTSSSSIYRAYPNGHYNLEIQDSNNPYEYTLLFTFRGFEIDPIMNDYDVRIVKVKKD